MSGLARKPRAEKIIVAYSPLEDAEPTLLDLFWNTLHEGLLLLKDVSM